MAQLSVLEGTETEKTRLEDRREISAAERQHAKEIEVYRKMLYAGLSEAEAVNDVVATNDVAVAEPAEETSAHVSGAAQRFADYKAYQAPATKKILFEGITYKNGELIEDVPAEVRPVRSASAATVVLPAPVSMPAEEDAAVPAPTTMETLGRSETETAAEESSKVSLLSAVSAKTKLVLAAIVFAIVLAIVVICINTGIINSLDADIEAMRARVQEQKQNYEELARELADMEDPNGSWSEMVKQYAEKNGMVQR
ncbi:MAG: hypothetical protein K2H43_00715 [Clostridia bacterium]|nr:hypothetical protein [Clostridia bacterium]